MARSYTDFYVYQCKDVEYTVKVPTPKEFQAVTLLRDVDGQEVKIVISNFSFTTCAGKREKYGVAMIELRSDRERQPHHDDEFWNLVKWEDRAKARNVMSFEGKNARKDAVAYVGQLLRHW